MATDNDTILARVQEQAALGVTTELDSVPKNLRDAVCDINRAVTHKRWRDGGWNITSVECDKGCCHHDLFTPPGVDPSSRPASKCTRGVRYEVLASYPERAAT